jgi:hypothetical protein
LIQLAGIELPDDRQYAERCPKTERACREKGIWLDRRLLLGSRHDIDDIIGGFTKAVEAFHR